jgi:hypothetical protein
MFDLHQLQPGLSTDIQTTNGLAFLTQYDILAPRLLINLVLGILFLEARQFISINSSLSLGFWPHQRSGALLGSCCLVAKILGAHPSSNFPELGRIASDYKTLKMYILVSFQHHFKVILLTKRMIFWFCLIFV